MKKCPVCGLKFDDPGYETCSMECEAVQAQESWAYCQICGSPERECTCYVSDAEMTLDDVQAREF
jgi:hypothetical protein